MNAMATVFAYLIGSLALAAAIFDWDWFFNNSRAVPFVRLFGRSGARIFYAILGGAFLAAASVAFLYG